MAKMGRPRKEINWDDFEKLCSIQCTLVEISEWFQCSEDTIERAVKRQYKETFAETFKKKSTKGKISLRRKMFDTALNGNVTMQIWLSKNVLGFKDHETIEHTGPDGAPINSVGVIVTIPDNGKTAVQQQIPLKQTDPTTTTTEKDISTERPAN